MVDLTLFSLNSLKPDSLVIPVLLSASSELFLLIQFISTREFFNKPSKVEDEEEFDPAVEGVSQGYIAKLRRHANRYGGVTIFVYRILRLLAVLGLVSLAVTTIVSGSKDAAHTTHHRNQFLNWSVLGAYVCFP